MGEKVDKFQTANKTISHYGINRNQCHNVCFKTGPICRRSDEFC